MWTEAPARGARTVVGVLMNDPAALAALGDAVHAPPYKAPPRAPVLFVKPRNTHALSGSPVAVPSGVDGLAVAASLGLVIGRTACRVDAAQARSWLAGFTLVADLSIPHSAFYRPSVRLKALDGSCLIGQRTLEVADPDALDIELRVDGRVQQRFNARGFVRRAAQLLADVTAFMTLQPGDILMLGTAHGAPTLRTGQSFEIHAAGFDPLSGRLVAQDT